MITINKRKEIINFLSNNLDVKINNKNIQEIEKKYKEAQSFLKREMLFHLPALIGCFFLPIVYKNFPSHNTLVSILNILLIICGVLIIIWNLLILYNLHIYKSKIKKYYQSNK